MNLAEQLEAIEDKQELLAIANDDYGLDVHHASGREKIIAEILAADAAANGDMGHSVTEDSPVPDVSESGPVPSVSLSERPPADNPELSGYALDKATAKELNSQAKVKIRIEEVEGETGYVEVGCNGRVYQIKRGEDVEVPYSVYLILKDAVKTLYDKKDSDGNIVPRDTSRFPMSKL